MATPETTPVFRQPADDTLAEVIPLFPEAQQPAVGQSGQAMDTAQAVADLVAQREACRISPAEYEERLGQLAGDIRARAYAADRGWRRIVYELYQISWED